MTIFSAISTIERLFKLYSVNNMKELAPCLEIAPSTISSWKNRNSIPLEILIKVSQDKNVSIDWLIFGKEETTLNNNDKIVLTAFNGADKATQHKALSVMMGLTEIPTISQVAQSGAKIKNMLANSNLTEATNLLPKIPEEMQRVMDMYKNIIPPYLQDIINNSKKYQLPEQFREIQDLNKTISRMLPKNLDVIVSKVEQNKDEDEDIVELLSSKGASKFIQLYEEEPEIIAPENHKTAQQIVRLIKKYGKTVVSIMSDTNTAIEFLKNLFSLTNNG